MERFSREAARKSGRSSMVRYENEYESEFDYNSSHTPPLAASSPNERVESNIEVERYELLGSD